MRHRRRSAIQIDVKQDRWLVSYADFVTLLFAFFVVMYSISQVSESKYRVLSSTLVEAFSVPYSAINPIQVGDPTTGVSPSAIEIFEQPDETENSEDTIEVKQDSNWQQLETEIEDQFKDLVDEKLLTINSNELWLELELDSSILFPTASAAPSLQAVGIFEEIARLFSDYHNPVQVEGFTDNVPISNQQFQSNWELSAARAASVVKLLATNGVDPVRLSAVGRGEFQPIASNDTEEGRAQNRRVVVMISKVASERPVVDSDEATNVVGDPVQSSSTNLNGSADPLSALSDGDDPIIDESSAPLIEPVPLNNGGLLFSSDPDLPRNNRNENNSNDGDVAESENGQADTPIESEENNLLLEDETP